jgi:hypothetical protein
MTPEEEDAAGMAFDFQIAEHIHNFGIAITAVFPDESSKPPVSFAYTIGLNEVGEPDLLVFGLNHTVSQPVLNEIYKRWVKGDVKLEEGYIPDMLGADSEFGVWLVGADPDLAGEYATGAARRFAMHEVMEAMISGKAETTKEGVVIPEELVEDGHYKPVPVLQVVIPDLAGNFPWEDDYSFPEEMQPSLTGAASWKGYDPHE